jgi:hypothetical protein
MSNVPLNDAINFTFFVRLLLTIGQEIVVTVTRALLSAAFVGGKGWVWGLWREEASLM